MKKETKTFIGGSVLGAIIGGFIVGFCVFAIMGTLFINYSLKQDKVCNEMKLKYEKNTIKNLVGNL
jgi:hypothetical protein